MCREASNAAMSEFLNVSSENTATVWPLPSSPRAASGVML